MINTENKLMMIAGSSEAFPVNFDDAWKWIGYSKKENAKRTLIVNFSKEIDYKILLLNKEEQKSGSGGHNKEVVVLSRDCFKSLAMMAGTEKGKEVRLYFIQCEKKLKEIQSGLSYKVTKDESLKSRIEFTTVLQSHNVKGMNIGVLTNYQYIKLFGTTAKGTKTARDPKTKTAKELLQEVEKTKLAAHEMLTRLALINMNANGMDDAKYCIRESATKINELIGVTTIAQIPLLKSPIQSNNDSLEAV